MSPALTRGSGFTRIEEIRRKVDATGDCFTPFRPAT
jgi:hypothetical protein